MKERNLLLDVLKGIAIIFVVLGHCIQFGSGKNYLQEEIYFNNEVFKIIYSFHMPLFMLISGYLFNHTVSKHTYAENIKSRITSLIIPLFSWSLIVFLLKSIVANIFFDACKVNILLHWGKVFVNIILYDLWFLWAIFYCSFFVLIINKFFKDRKILYISFFILTFLIPDKFGSALYKYMYPFFVFGYFFPRYESKIAILIKRNRILLMLITLLGFFYVGLMQFYVKTSYIYTSGYYIFNSVEPAEQLKTDLYRFLIGLIGSVFVILLIKILFIITELYSAKYVWKCIAYIGRNSLGIYIISNCFLNKVLTKFTSNLYTINYFMTIIETILVIVVTLGISVFIKKIHFMNKLFLGAR